MNHNVSICLLIVLGNIGEMIVQSKGIATHRLKTTATESCRVPGWALPLAPILNKLWFHLGYAEGPVTTQTGKHFESFQRAISYLFDRKFYPFVLNPRSGESCTHTTRRPKSALYLNPVWAEGSRMPLGSQDGLGELIISRSSIATHPGVSSRTTSVPSASFMGAFVHPNNSVYT